MMSIFIRTSSIFSRHPLYSPCTYVICRLGLYFVACKRSLQQASIDICDSGVAAACRSLDICVCCQMACVRLFAQRLLHYTDQIFPVLFFFIAHLSKTLGVFVFCFVRVH